MLGLMFCILVGFIYRRYQRLRHGNHRKLKNSDENLVEENCYHDNREETEHENELFDIRLHKIQSSILTLVSPKECDQDLVQDATVSSSSDERLNLFLFFRKLIK